MAKLPRKNLPKNLKNQKQKEEENKPKPKKMTGILFYLVLMIVLVDDLLDLASNGTGILSIISPLSTIFVGWILIMYFLFEKVDLKGKKMGQKVGTWSACAILEFIPFLSVLPMGSVALIATRILENNETLKKVAKTIK